MSRASEWAEAQVRGTRRVNPPGFWIHELRFHVRLTHSGTAPNISLDFNHPRDEHAGFTLEVPDALALARWILATFGDEAPA